MHNLRNYGFDDRAASAIVQNGRWEVCSDADYRGRCVTLLPGQYRSLGDLNLNFQVSSVRPLAPEPVARSYAVPAPNAYTPDDAYREGYRAGMQDGAVVRDREEHHWLHRDGDD